MRKIKIIVAVLIMGAACELSAATEGNTEFIVPIGFSDQDNNSGYGLFDLKKGKFIVEPTLGYIGDLASNGLTRVKQNGKWGYINSQGQMAIPVTFDSAHDFVSNGLARVEQNGKWGYINSQGQMAIPATFDDADKFASNDLAYVEQNGKRGYINSQGQMAIPATFDAANNFASNGLAQVKKNGKQAYINTEGKKVVYQDSVCDTSVIKNADDQVIWPRKSVADICAEAAYTKGQSEQSNLRSEAERQMQANRACAHVYVGKEFEVPARGLFGAPHYYIIVGVSNQAQQVTVRGKFSDIRQEITCDDVPR